MLKIIHIYLFAACFMPIVCSGSDSDSLNANPEIELHDIHLGPEYDAKRVDRLLNLLNAANSGEIDRLINILEGDLARVSISFTKWDTVSNYDTYYQEVKKRLTEYREKHGAK